MGTVRVLGELAVDGVDVRTGLDRKARTLLRLLALAQGRAVAADALAEALWGDRAPARPADQVAVLASRLRRQLGRDAVQHGDHGYRLVGVEVDVETLRTVVAEAERRRDAGEPGGAMAAARIALSLVRGPVPAPEIDADWATADHAAAQRLVRHARRVAVEVLLAAGAWADALDLAEGDWTEDPFDEVAVRAVMRAEAAAGRPARALQAFATLRATLADELGTDPDAETDALHAALLRGDRPTALRTSVVPPGLVGRTSQLEHLDGLVARLPELRTRVAVVSGDAGIGKTTLLRSWTAARVDAGDVVLTGTCGQLDRSSPLDVVLTAIAEHVRRSTDPDALLGEEGAMLDAPASSALPDPVLGPATLYAAATAVLGRIAAGADAGGVVLVIDDAHLAGPALADWLTFVLRRPLPLLVVAAVRPAEGPRLPSTDTVNLGPLDLAATTELVGTERAAELHARSGGHPLFLSELAGAEVGAMPDSLVAAVRDRCDQLGAAADPVRAGAVLGGDLDVELVASVLGRSPLEVLDDIESAAEQGLLVERAGRYSFRHELVREALAAGTTAARSALLHREAARMLASRPDADPVRVADHARRGGDVVLAAEALRRAAERSSSRFDHTTADRLLGESLALVPDDATSITRARVHIRLGRYAEAEAEALAVPAGSAASCEVAAWAAYFDRRFDDAVRHADVGTDVALDDDSRARCLIVGGRTRHARGDLTRAHQQLEQAATMSTGADRLTASAWLGVLLAHRSRAAEALPLLLPATHPGVGVDHTSAALHALLFAGHAQATAGRPAEALTAFARYSEEVERRHVPRFGGRGLNFGGWVLRNLGAVEAAADAHHEALAVSAETGTAELRVAALEDLAEDRVWAGDADAAAALLADAARELTGDLVFGWRLAMKLRLLHARTALLAGRPEGALGHALALREAAEREHVPRYSSVARVLEHRARAALGEPVDADAVAADLATVAEAVRVEAWWWTGETGAALGLPALLDRAEGLAAELAAAAGEHGDTLRSFARRRLDSWSVSALS